MYVRTWNEQFTFCRLFRPQFLWPNYYRGRLTSGACTGLQPSWRRSAWQSTLQKSRVCAVVPSHLTFVARSPRCRPYCSTRNLHTHPFVAFWALSGMWRSSGVPGLHRAYRTCIWASARSALPPQRQPAEKMPKKRLPFRILVDHPKFSRNGQRSPTDRSNGCAGVFLPFELHGDPSAQDRGQGAARL